MINFLGSAEIHKLLPMSKAIDLMREAFMAISSGKAILPIRQNMPLAEHSGNSLIMPCYLPGCGFYGIKIANVFLKNANNNLPTIQSIYHLFDEKNGSLLLSMDGGMLTKIRTGAASALATQMMDGKESTVLAIFGTGIQAESHIEAIINIAKIEKVLIFSRNKENAEKLIRTIALPHHALFLIADDPGQLKEADIICTTTPSYSALFKKEHLKQDVHINAIGAFKPEMIEVPVDVTAESTIVVDQFAGAFDEAGEIIQAIGKGLIKKEDLFGELGELVSGEKIFAKGAKPFSLFKSVGNALQDLICAKYIYESEYK